MVLVMCKLCNYPKQSLNERQIVVKQDAHTYETSKLISDKSDCSPVW